MPTFSPLLLLTCSASSNEAFSLSVSGQMYEIRRDLSALIYGADMKSMPPFASVRPF